MVPFSDWQPSIPILCKASRRPKRPYWIRFEFFYAGTRLLTSLSQCAQGDNCRVSVIEDWQVHCTPPCSHMQRETGGRECTEKQDGAEFVCVKTTWHCEFTGEDGVCVDVCAHACVRARARHLISAHDINGFIMIVLLFRSPVWKSTSVIFFSFLFLLTLAMSTLSHRHTYISFLLLRLFFPSDHKKEFKMKWRWNRRGCFSGTLQTTVQHSSSQFTAVQ